MRLSLNKFLTKDQLKALAATERWKKEVAGTLLGATPLRTDRDSQNLCNGAVAYLSNQPDGAMITFKGASGWVSLDLAAVKAIAIAVGDHVQLCFAKEQEVVGLIDAGTIKLETEVVAAFAPIVTAGFPPE